MKKVVYFSLILAMSGCSSTSPVSSSDLRAPFTENKDQVESCYDKVSAKQPDLGTGSVELKFLINEDGRAYKTIFMKKRSTLSNKLLNACLKKVVQTWQFPKGKSLEVVYPFQFEKTGGALSDESKKSVDEPEKQSDLDVIDTSPSEDESSGDEETPAE